MNFNSGTDSLIQTDNYSFVIRVVYRFAVPIDLHQIKFIVPDITGHIPSFDLIELGRIQLVDDKCFVI